MSMEPKNCPECGAQATDESITEKRLSDLGYMHEDVYLRCSDCSHRWAHGVPIGDHEQPDDLDCGACDGQMLVHRVWPRVNDQGVTVSVHLHLKCPDCFNFDITSRYPDETGRALIGYAAITGSTEGCQPYGYPSDVESWSGQDTGVWLTEEDEESIIQESDDIAEALSLAERKVREKLS